ncbi:MAG: YfhO family protein [Actinomycetota bacterium]|nr:YfhO family protein [Actinomycetota bacterium]
MFVLFALTVVAAWDFLRGEIVVGPDAVTQFYPWYSFLGESLRSGDIPAWNPHQFSGTPFAADPLSGWTYLPAMLLFAFLPLVAAAKSYLFLHLLLAALFSYALARSLGMEIPGALLAAVAYGYSGFLYLSNTCCFAYPAVMSWLPLTILGAELAIRSPRWLERVLWWGVSGLALSQILAAWLGQGSYYALLALGGYVAYRTLLSPPGDASGGLTQKMAVPYELLGAPFLGAPTSIIRLGFTRKNLRRAGLGLGSRLLRCVLHGGAVLVFGLGLAAAGVLPRLEYNALSNLAGGYSDIEIGPSVGLVELPVQEWSSLLLEPGAWYVGAPILALALLAPVVAWKRFAVPYFAVLSFGALILMGQETTALHSALYLLPYFERLHPHDPDRVMVVFYLGAALLAGAALMGLKERVGRKRLVLVLPILTTLFLARSILISLFEEAQEKTAIAGRWEALFSLLSKNGVPILAGPLFALILAVVLVAAYTLIPARLAIWRNFAFALLILVVFADLLAESRATIAEYGVNREKMDLAAYYHPSDAARFLQARGETEEPFRYLGFAPQYVGAKISGPAGWNRPLVGALGVNNRAMTLGLQNIQGYNALQIARYPEYMRALNGYEQSYHYADIFDKELDSPLLDLLNVRYVIVPADTPPESQPGLQRMLLAQHPTVYEDGRLKVLERKGALPRAWIVHSARQVGSREEALDLVSSGGVDLKETAFLEEEPPEMSEPHDASADRASVEEYDADRMELKTTTEAPGLLVLGEVYYPAWKAYVDGEPAPVYITDHLLRSVPIPAGEHTVELRYESWTLRTGIAISLVACAALVALAVAAGVRRWRKTGKKPPANEPTAECCPPGGP